MAEAPDTLLCVTERYKVPGRTLLDEGYEIADPRASYWFTRRWDRESETWFLPQALSDPAPPVPDVGRSVRLCRSGCVLRERFGMMPGYLQH